MAERTAPNLPWLFDFLAEGTEESDGGPLIPCFEGKGVLIKKEGSQIGLHLEDARELVEKLIEYLAAQ